MKPSKACSFCTSFNEGSCRWTRSRMHYDFRLVLCCVYYLSTGASRINRMTDSRSITQGLDWAQNSGVTWGSQSLHWNDLKREEKNADCEMLQLCAATSTRSVLLLHATFSRILPDVSITIIGSERSTDGNCFCDLRPQASAREASWSHAGCGVMDTLQLKVHEFEQIHIDVCSGNFLTHNIVNHA